MNRTISPRPASLTRLALFLLTALAALVLTGFGARQAQASAKTYYVATDGNDNNDGLTWATALQHIQTAINAASASNHDQVWVKAGVYIGNFMAVDGVPVYGHFIGTETSITQRPLTNMTSADTSYLDANGSGTVYTVPSAAIKTNTLDGFTVENAAGRGVSDLSNDTLVVANCTFSNNVYSYSSGAGIYDDGLIATITDCIFTGNSSTYYGGGIYIGNNTVATVDGCTFTGNSAEYGGGIYSIGTVTVGKDASGNKSDFASNSATGSAIYTSGDGITTVNDSILTGNSGRNIDSFTTTNIINDCSFTGSTAESTAGIDVTGTTSMIANCIFSNNVYSYGSGAGIYDSSQSSTITSCTFTDNSVTYYGGGIYIDSGTSAMISKSTFTSNSAEYGGGIYSSGTSTIADCTFNTDSPDAVDLENTGTPPAPAIVKDSLIVGSGTSTGDANGIDLGIGGGSTTYVYADVFNNTIAKTNIGIDIGTTGGAVIVANNILYENRVGLSGNSTITFTSSHNDGYGNVSYYYEGVDKSSSDIMLDPLFVNAPMGDYHLTSGSPCIDAGYDSYVVSGDKDLNGNLDGNPRILGAHVDIGCYEYVIASAHLTSLSPTPVTAGSPAFTLTVNGTGFFTGSIVHFGTASLATTYVSSTQLKASVPASDVATAGTASVTVSNSGVAASNALTFTIAAPPAATWKAVAVSAAPGGGARILWNRSDGAAGVWVLGANDAVTAVGPTYGPIAGWTAKAIATANDGTSRVLWTNVNGQAGIWTFNASGIETSEGPAYGPYSGWSAKAVVTAGDGTSRVLWTNTNGEMGVWSFGVNDVETIIGPTYGPIAGWSAVSISATSDGTSRVLWTNTNGEAGLWSFGTNDAVTRMGTVYGPYTGWTAKAVGTAGDGTSRVLWTNVNGDAGVWSFGVNDVQTLVGPVYGPYSGWSAGALGTAYDGTSRVLWNNVSRAAGVWTFNASDGETVIGTTYGPY